MSRSRKVLVLALDAASPHLLREWAADGSMPNLAQLMHGGLVAETHSVNGMYVGATWPSFYMSADPSWHGLYWTDRMLVGTYRTQRLRPEDLAHYPALWEVLSHAGRRVVVVDVPLTRISPKLNGPQIVEWGVHDDLMGFQTRPRSLRRKIRSGVGLHPAPTNCDAQRSNQDYRVFAGQLCAGAAARAELTLELLADDEWDFAIQVFSETHCAGHQLWHFHDPGHPAFQEPGGDVPGDLVREVYQAVDEALGRILSSLDSHTTVVLMSLHGMDHACGGSLLLPQILERLGVGGAENGAKQHSPESAAPQAAPVEDPARAPRGLLRSLYHLLPDSIRERLYRMRQRANQDWLGRGSPMDLDTSRAKAFYVGFGVGSTFSGIRLNLEGREPTGQLAPGRQADDFCERLIADLLEITRPGSSNNVVRAVHRTADLFSGPRLDQLPDLLVEWEPDPAMGTAAAGSGEGAEWVAESPKIGRVQAHNGYCRTGEHRIDGLMIAKGRSIPPGKLGRTVSILDIAPTLAALLDVQMPSPEGQPIPELLGPQLWG